MLTLKITQVPGLLRPGMIVTGSGIPETLAWPWLIRAAAWLIRFDLPPRKVEYRITGCVSGASS
jgi:hypothetical protein